MIYKKKENPPWSNIDLQCAVEWVQFHVCWYLTKLKNHIIAIIMKVYYILPDARTYIIENRSKYLGTS